MFFKNGYLHLDLKHVVVRSGREASNCELLLIAFFFTERRNDLPLLAVNLDTFLLYF